MSLSKTDGEITPKTPKPNLPPPSPSLGAVLKNRNFLTLWSGQVFSQLADKIYLVLTIAIITSEFQQQEQTISGWVSAIMIAFTIPAVLFGSLAGVFVDRWPKKSVLVLTNVLRGAFVLTIPLFLSLSAGIDLAIDIPLGFALLLGITFAVSTLTQFFAPAEQAIIPLIVKRHLLLPANSLYTSTMMASVILGFALGDPLLNLASHLISPILGNGDLGKEVLVGGGYLLAGVILLVVNTQENTYPPDHEHPHVLQDLRDGLQFLRDRHRVRNAILQLIILSCIFAALAVLAVRIAEIIPSLEPSQFGLLLAVGGIGLGISSAVVGEFGHRWGSNAQLSLIGSMGMAGSLLGLSFTVQYLGWSLFWISLLGSSAAFIGIPMQTTIQSQTPEEMRGKVFGLQNNAINIALSFPLALVSMAEAGWGIQVVLAGLALLVFAGGVSTWYISRTGDRDRSSLSPTR
ncbi:MAG: MFS transporter [Roseofilum sp. Belize BBD 4]|uniref:MFS transporter n=1 Tax=Roseofilum sp. Belize BBD 4 TaxID=2821500 RepID=UPI001B1DE7FB|nr:MFS transporter [Roseofilum sp. Belize BBD 4]MBP0032807.1 MFS transporter [Roseofilum sp. Belize BBD 4]